MIPLRKNLLPFLTLLLLAACSGVVTGTGGGGELTPESEGGSGDGSGESGTETGVSTGGETVSGGGAAEYTGEAAGGGSSGGSASSSGGLYTGGPVDIPVPIAKVESIDPRYVIVTLAGNQLTLRGEAGAVTNVSASPQVWTQDSLTGEIKTTVSNSDGSFETITFSYGSDQPSTSVTVAGYDGTSIGTPVFLKVSNNLYVWILTNGSSVSRGSLAMDGDTVYMVIHVDGSGAPAPALTRSGERGTATSSYLYTLDVGGVPEIAATGDIVTDQLFVTEGEVLARSGNNFYIPEGSGFKKLFSIGSAETIAAVDVDTDFSGKQWIAVATDRAIYTCDRTGSCKEILDVDAKSSPATFQSLVTMNWIKQVTSQSSMFMLNVVWLEGLGNTFNPASWYYSPPDGTPTKDSPQMSFTWYETDSIRILSTGTYIWKGILEPELRDNQLLNYRPARWVTTCSNPLPADHVRELQATMIGSGSNYFYLLDAEVTINTLTPLQYGNFATYKDAVCYAKRTRTIYNAEIYPDESLVFFCAEDESGKGQMYALCTDKIEGWSPSNPMPQPGSGQTGYKGVPGDEIVQLTEGEEHCTEEKNWKIDRHVAANGDVTTNAVVIVNTSDPTKPQIQFIDPYNEPLLTDCLD